MGKGSGTHLRVRVETAERVRALAARVQASNEFRLVGDQVGGNWEGGVTTDEVINWLIDQREAYERRRAKAARSAAARRRAGKDRQNDAGGPFQSADDVAIPSHLMRCDDGVVR